MNPDLPCPHDNIMTSTNMVLLTDTGKRQVELRVWCTDCDEPFLWPEEIMIGVDLNGVARSFDRKELRVAVTSAADVPDLGVDGAEGDQ